MENIGLLCLYGDINLFSVALLCLWPLILKFIDLYFAMLAPRICHEDGRSVVTELLTAMSKFLDGILLF